MKLEDHILEYENDFFKKEFCQNKDNLNKRIHHEFMEIGQSGVVYNKESIIDYLSNLDGDRSIEILDFKIKQIKDDLVVANYLSKDKTDNSKTLRTSIWTKERTEWSLFFHQGTPALMGETDHYERD